MSVGLAAEPTSELAALLERGVAPAMVAVATGEGRDEAGATEWVGENVPATSSGLDLPPGAAAHKEDRPNGDAPSLYRFTFHSLDQRRRFDGRAVDSLSVVNRMGRRWLQTVERVLPRVRPLQRFLYLAPEEVLAMNPLSADFLIAEKL